MSELSSIRSRLYASLAHCFQGPKAEFLRPAGDNPLLKSLKEFAREGSVTSLKEEAGELWDALEEQSRLPGEEVLRALEVEHARLFIGPGPAVAPPYESVYLDPQGLVMGTWATQVLHWYAEEGLSLSSGFRDCPDHVGAELEFMAYLCWREAEAQEEWRVSKLAQYRRKQLAFLQRHLCLWAPSFCRRVLSASPSTFYGCLASVLRGVTHWDRERLASTVGSGATAQSPVGETLGQSEVLRQIQVDAKACTFCEACIATCPLGALRLSRQPSEVLLLLAPAHCDLCGLCEGACPEGAIHIGESPPPLALREKEENVVARSPRLRCQRCGQPLEAQGLLEATLSKLKEVGDSQRLQEAVGLCSECRDKSLALAFGPRRGRVEGTDYVKVFASWLDSEKGGDA